MAQVFDESEETTTLESGSGDVTASIDLSSSNDISTSTEVENTTPTTPPKKPKKSKVKVEDPNACKIEASGTFENGIASVVSSKKSTLDLNRTQKININNGDRTYTYTRTDISNPTKKEDKSS